MDAAKIGIFCLGLFSFALAIVGEFSLSLVLNAMVAGESGATPGLGIRMLGLIDLALAWTLLLMAVEIVHPIGTLAKIQGFITFVLSLFGIFGGFVLIFTTITLLILMVSLLLAFPFGTTAYMVTWANFPTGYARGILVLLMTFKLIGTGLVVVASPTLIRNKGLVVLLALSIGLTFLTGLLIGFVPTIVAAIADVIAALISAIAGTVWMLVLLIGSLGSIRRAARSTGN